MTERPSVRELWPDLAEPVRERFLACGHEHWQQVYEDVALQNQDWIPAGVFSRFSPAGAGGVVNLTQGALTGGLLLVNDLED